MSQPSLTAAAKWFAHDLSLALWMHGAASRRWVVAVLRPVSRAGNGWLWYAVVVLLPWAGGESGVSAATRMVGVAIVNIVIYKALKHWIGRPRPFRTCLHIHECVPSLDEFSFPSGHTLHSVACSVILTAYYPVLAWVVWPFTLLLTASRIVLGSHYPSDVVVGASLGALTAIVSFNLL